MREVKKRYDPEKIKKIARDLQGIPYLHNGRTEKGVDCWGLVRLFFARLQVELPEDDGSFIEKDWYKRDPDRYLRELCNLGEEVGHYKNMRPLDIPYFRLYKNVVTHTSVMLDRISFIHVLINKEVSIDTMKKRYWRRKYEGARRLVEPELIVLPEDGNR